MRIALLLAISAMQAVDPHPASNLTFSTPTQGQKTVGQLSGKVVALEFSYSTCQPCKAVSERLKKLAADLGPGGFEAYDIAFDVNARAMSEATVSDLPAASPGLPLGWANPREVRSFLQYAPSDRLSVPQLVLLDRNGQIRYQTALTGTDPLRTEATLRAHIVELLAPAPAAPSPTIRARKNRK